MTTSDGMSEAIMLNSNRLALSSLESARATTDDDCALLSFDFPTVHASVYPHGNLQPQKYKNMLRGA
jgi:hypothetical protein